MPAHTSPPPPRARVDPAAIFSTKKNATVYFFPRMKSFRLGHYIFTLLEMRGHPLPLNQGTKFITSYLKTFTSFIIMKSGEEGETFFCKTSTRIARKDKINDTLKTCTEITLHRVCVCCHLGGTQVHSSENITSS